MKWNKQKIQIVVVVFLSLFIAACGKEEEYVDGVIPVQYTEELSVLDKMKYANSTYAYQDGKVYYRRYHEDSYEEAALWGNYDAVPGAKKEIVCLDEDGVETVLFDDDGYGNIYLIADRFYMQTRGINIAENNINIIDTRLYSVDMQGNDRIDYGYGDILAIDRELNIVILKLWEEGKACYYAMNYETGEKKLILSDLDDYDSIGAYQNGWLYYIKYERRDDIDVSTLRAVSTDGEERDIIELTSADYDFTSTSLKSICNMEVDKDRIYFVYGGHSGSTNMFDGGKLISISLDGTDYKAVDTIEDAFYLCHDNGKTLVYFPQYFEWLQEEDGYNMLVWDEDADICYISDFPPNMLDAYKRSVYDNLSTRGSQYFMNRMILCDVTTYESEAERYRTDIYAIPDDSGEIVKVVMDIEQFITKWEEEEAEYIFYDDLYFADGFLYFKVEYNVYDRETSIGWRDGFRRLHTDIYRLKIGEDKAQILYSY